MIINKNNKYKKLYERDHQTIKSFDKLYSKSLQYNVIDKNEYESFSNFITKYLEGKKLNLFNKIEHEDKIDISSKNKLNFQLRTQKK